jgi:hypothetical protein
LAIHALTEKNVNDESAFSDIVSISYDWLINENKITQTEYLELDILCLKFLEKFFLLEKSYLKLIKVSEVMLNIFIENKLDQFSISTAKMIIHCFTELKDFSQCEKYELLLLDSILTNKDIPSFVSQQIQLGVVSSRISRGDGDLALSLLNKIEDAGDNNPNMLIPISLLKADIAYLKNNLHHACREYSAILDNLYSKNQDTKQLEFIIEKLKLIQKEIGEEEFDKILDEQNVSSLRDLLEPVQN